MLSTKINHFNRRVGHSFNFNIVHRWLRELSYGTLLVQPLKINITLTRSETLPKLLPPSQADIRIEVYSANTTIVFNWPVQGDATCALSLRE